MSLVALPTFPLAHAGHWYHSLLYVLPIVVIALAMWWSGRRDRGRENRNGEGGDGGRGGSSSEG